MNGTGSHQAEVVERVLCLPVMLRLRGQVSLGRLLDETGYREFEGVLGRPQWREGIGGRMGLVETWLAYSTDKQENWGWYFEGPHKGQYLVGCRTSFTLAPGQFTDPFEACAYFIDEEIGAIRGREAGPPGSRSAERPG